MGGPFWKRWNHISSDCSSKVVFQWDTLTYMPNSSIGGAVKANVVRTLFTWNIKLTKFPRSYDTSCFSKRKSLFYHTISRPLPLVEKCVAIWSRIFLTYLHCSKILWIIYQTVVQTCTVITSVVRTVFSCKISEFIWILFKKRVLHFQQDKWGFYVLGIRCKRMNSKIRVLGEYV